jgi:hypothetical protein
LLKAALAAMLPGDAWAQTMQLAPSPSPGFITGLDWLAAPGDLIQQVRRGVMLLQRRQPDDAVAILARASRQAEADPSSAMASRIAVNGAYGYALFTTGKAQQALDVLSEELVAEQTLRTQRIAPYAASLEEREKALGGEIVREEARRQLSSVIVIEGAPLTPELDGFAAEVIIGCLDCRATLARAMLESGQTDALTALYHDHVANDPTLPNDFSARIARERRLGAFAVLLARADQRPLAADAFSQAAALNFARERTFASLSPSYMAMLGSFTAGRTLLGERVGFYLGAAPERNQEATQAGEMLARIVEQKGLGIRYAERANQLFATSTNPDTIAAWQRRGELETQLAVIGASPFALLQFVSLGAQMSRYMEQALPDLRARGLDRVVVAGDTLLPGIRAALGQSAAIGYLRYSAATTANGSATAHSRYVRYCCANGSIELRDVGSADEIDRAAYAFRRALLADRDPAQQGEALARVLLAELPGGVASASSWVVDPDGAIALVPFELLPDEHGDSQLTRRAIRYVTSLAQLASGALGTPAPLAAGPACIVANPAYPAPARASDDSDVAGWRLTSASLTRGSVNVPALADTAEEADEVRRSLSGLGIKAQLYEGAAATPDALLGLARAPAVLHVASHAVLFDTHVTPKPGDAPATGNPLFDMILRRQLAQAAATGKPALAPPGSQAAKAAAGNLSLDLVLPGRRSGLVLAGVSRPSVMYASDLARLPLRGTQLAVLSGCNTGNGDVDLGEGISSLRRSLEEAGAASTVTSLWPVPSLATAMLMGGFYRELAKRRPKSEALRRAKLALRDAGHPASAWAGFLLAGDDAPLRAA